MKSSNRGLVVFFPVLVATASIVTLLIGLGGNIRVAQALVPVPVCFATPDGGTTIYASGTFTAVQAAVDSLGASGGEVLVAGTCTGVQERESVSQTIYITAPVTLRGGYDMQFNVLDPGSNPTVLDANTLGRVIVATADITVENLTLQNGLADIHGGGLFSTESLFMENSQVLSNTAPFFGGGIGLYGSATIVNSRIENNRSSNSQGGGLSVASNLYMTNTLVISNTADKGGGVYVSNSAMLVDSRIVNNHSTGDTGGGLYVNSMLVMTNTEVLSNTSFYGGGGIHAGQASIVDSLVENNSSIDDEGGGLRILGALAMSSTEVLSNTAQEVGGGIRVNGPATIASSRFENNRSIDNDGGGLYFDDTLTMTYTHVLNNVSSGYGGGVYLYKPASIVNSLLVSNTAAIGGAIWSESPLRLADSTLVANHAITTGGAISSTDILTITNNIIWLNTPSQVGSSNAIFGLRNIIQDSEGGGFDTDPLFIRNPNPASGELGDLHLSELSPAIDAGNDDQVPAALTTDLDGNPRFHDVLLIANNNANIVDLGAYEHNSQLTPPTADAGGPYNGVEGTPVALDGSGSSGIRALSAYAWDCTNDGAFDASGPNPADSSCPYADNGLFNLRLVVTDTVSLTGTDTITLTILNAAPVVTAPTAQNATARNSQSFSLGSFSDAGVNDSPWQVQIDWGDGSPPTALQRDAQGNLPSQDHTYSEEAQYSVTITVTDKDDGASSASFDVNVGPPDTGSLQGTVYEDKNGNQQPDSGEGVAGVSVSLTEVTAAAFTNPVNTDQDGAFVFSNVPVGEYEINVSASGYMSPDPVPVTVEKDVVKGVEPILIEEASESVFLPAIQSIQAE